MLRGGCQISRKKALRNTWMPPPPLLHLSAYYPISSSAISSICFPALSHPTTKSLSLTSSDVTPYVPFLPCLSLLCRSCPIIRWMFPTTQSLSYLLHELPITVFLQFPPFDPWLCLRYLPHLGLQSHPAHQQQVLLGCGPNNDDKEGTTVTVDNYRNLQKKQTRVGQIILSGILPVYGKMSQWEKLF